MNDFHNQINGYTSQNHFSPFHSTYNQSITDPGDNIEGTHPIHNIRSKTDKQAESNQRDQIRIRKLIEHHTHYSLLPHL